MNYSKSAIPYVFLLCLILLGIPFWNYKVKAAQSIKKEIKVAPACLLSEPLALN